MIGRHKLLSEIEDLEDFTQYAIDIEGNLWSLKYNKLKKRKPNWSGKGDYAYLTCRLVDNTGSAKTLYIHKLVALAFLPTNDPSQRVLHHDGDRSNNALSNLYWSANVTKKGAKKESLNFVLHEDLVNRILQVHIAAQKKGLKVGDSYSFTTQMVENAIESYIMQYGLRKVDRDLWWSLLRIIYSLSNNPNRVSYKN